MARESEQRQPGAGTNADNGCRPQPSPGCESERRVTPRPSDPLPTGCPSGESVTQQSVKTAKCQRRTAHASGRWMVDGRRRGVRQTDQPPASLRRGNVSSPLLRRRRKCQAVSGLTHPTAQTKPRKDFKHPSAVFFLDFGDAIPTPTPRAWRRGSALSTHRAQRQKYH